MTAKLPAPPSRLADKAPFDPTEIAAGTLWARVYSAGGLHPGSWDRFRTYGPLATGRFDHHLEPPGDGQRAIMYLAGSLQTCTAEAFQAARVVDRRHNEPWLVAFRLARSVRLCDLTGTWPTKAGASQAISTGRRDRSRQWARAIHEAFPEADGILYRSSMDSGRPCMALFERASTAVPDAPELHLPLSHPGLVMDLATICTLIGYRLV